MNVQAEISLYPLRSRDLRKPIESFLRELEAAGLSVRPGMMSSVVAGEESTVFSKVGAAFRTVAENGQVVLVMKVSNACPSDRTTDEANADDT